LVSVVIPCYNPGEYLLEAIASVRAQSCGPVELIVVNDGTDRPESFALLKKTAAEADRYIEQSNQGLAAARNSGFAAAQGEYVLPLDCDDLIRPEYLSRCLAAFGAFPEAAFIHTDYDVFGVQNYPERCSYNLYRLLEQNTLTYAAVIRKSDWEQAGGYDPAMRYGYEDWEFWLRLGSRDRFGAHIPERLFRYRKHGRSLYDTALSRHDEIVAYIRNKHSALYAYESVTRIKAIWMPAVCVAGGADTSQQTIRDLQKVSAGAVEAVCAQSRAPAILIPGSAPLDPHSAELAALAVWGGTESVRFGDGSLAISRQASATGRREARSESATVGNLGVLRRHLVNAELDSWKSWRRHPVRSLLRLIPLRLKESINQLARRQVFDLSFYLRFQPRAVLGGTAAVDCLRYYPQPADRKRIALVTPHLGPGGAETVLLEIAAALQRAGYEILVIATQSEDQSWTPRWRAVAEHVYDLSRLVSSERMSAAICSVITNWRSSGVLLQNTLFGYAAAPLIRKEAPSIRLIDIVHAVAGDWDFAAATASAVRSLDLRIAVSDQVRTCLLQAGVEAERIQLIRNGVDTSRFSSRRPSRSGRTILFLGRLDRVKRPLLLVDIAEELLRRSGASFRFVVAGDGPELKPLQLKLRKRKLDGHFELRGFVEDPSSLLAEADVLLLPSRAEGLPLAVLEAIASGCPVVAANVGSVGEAVDETCGLLIDAGHGEVSRFAAALDRILDDAELRQRMGAAGRRRVESLFDLAAARAAYSRLFD
jgi:glycosyltransferase involved in cell wall biosynthesis